MKKLRSKKTLVLLTHLILHALLFVSWLPIARVFYQAEVPLGIDTVNFVYYTADFRDNPAFPVSGWKYQAFEGMPRLLDTTWLHFYLIQPFVSLLGILSAVKLYPLIFLFLFLVFGYFLFYEISRNHFLSAGLALLLSRTGAIYIPLYSSGVVLSSLSQTFYPMMLYFLARFVNRNEQKSLYLAALALTLGMYTHPGTTTVVTFVSAVIFLVFFFSRNVRFFAVRETIKITFKFFAIAGLVGALAILPLVYTRLVEGGHQWIQINLVPEERAFLLLFATLNPVIFVAIPISLLLGIFFMRKVNRLSLSVLIILVYLLLFLWALWAGKNPLGGFMFPHRIYWGIVLSSLAFVAALVSPRSHEEFGKLKRVVYRASTYGLLPIVLATSLLVPINEVLDFLNEGVITGEIWKGEESTDPAKVYGGKFLSSSGTDLSFFEGADLDYRFYAVDYAYNLSLGTATPLPQARGGFHFSTERNVNWYAWLDAVLSQESQTKGRLAPYVAEQQSLYLLDWYAIDYLYSWPGQPGMLAPWLLRKDSPYVEKRQAKGENIMLKIREEFTSPIAKTSNAKVIGFVGSRQGYDSFLRNLGVLNYHSQYVVPIHIARYLEEIKEEDLANLDGLFIYSYREKDKEKHLQGWEKVRNFANGGGVVLVETGSYSPEKYLESLPEVFPVRRVTSGSVGTSWLVSQKSDVFADVDFSGLSPLTYEGSYWGVDYAESLRPGATVDLAIGDKVVIAERQIGRGKFIWSGLNLPYRMHYFFENAENEARIFKCLLDRGFEVDKEELSDFTSERAKSEKVVVSGQGAKGVLFKENDYGGWYARVISDGASERLKIYPAGPDFMYVRLPDHVGKGAFEVVFEYKGKPENWLFFTMTLVGLAIVLDGLIMNHRLIKAAFSPLVKFFAKIREKMTTWWEKDEAV